MDSKSSHTIKLRLFFETPNKRAIAELEERLNQFDILVENATDRAIDASAAVSAFECALLVKFADENGSPQLATPPELKLETTEEEIQAYIPNTPVFF